MKHPLFAISAIGVLALFGAGCSSAQPSNIQNVTSTDTYPSSTTTGPTFPTSTMPSTTSTQSTTSTSVNDQKNGSSTLAFPGILPAAQANKKIRIKTNLGDIVIQTSVTLGPRAASNFVYLVQHNFYNGTIFHRVIPGFMIQGGDPTGTGMGGPGYQFEDDPVKSLAADPQHPGYVIYKTGTVAMANAGPSTNGSQFFIMVDDVPLPPDYSVFGKVISGQDIAKKIAETSRDASDRPLSEVKMISVTIEK